MTLILSNEDVKQVLDMEITMTTLDAACQELRIDIQIPTPSAATFKVRSFSPLRGKSMSWRKSGAWAGRSDRVVSAGYPGLITVLVFAVRGR
jgi:hypothetical protein